MKQVEIVIIGAGAAGIGFGTALHLLGMNNFVILERGEVGESFLNWPEETRFITPSFTTNGFGFPDLNAVVPNTSPAFTFGKEHLSGVEYADYLQLIADNYQLPIEEEVEVLDVLSQEKGYYVVTNQGIYATKYVIVAMGEFGNPYVSDIKGAEHGIHYGEIEAFEQLDGAEYAVIGGNESGVDAAVNLTELGKKVTLYTGDTGLSAVEADPSIRLSPTTITRYRQFASQLTLKENCTLNEIQAIPNGYRLLFENGEAIESLTPPILATGFRNAVQQLQSPLFEYDAQHNPHVNEKDESTLYPNVFLVGPSVRQNKIIFCYIYKFRQRFMPIIMEIAAREQWHLAPEVLALYQRNQMILTDLECCDVICDC